MNGLDLFSGIGGLTKALEGYVIPVAYCEIEPYARAVLLSRMHARDLPLAPIWDDILTLHGTMLPQVDIIYGGFPCQDISVAGRGKGLEGERSGLFFEIMRLAQEVKPKFLFLENVPNIRTKGLSRVIRELADLGYDCRWSSLSAADLGANHKRKRWFLLAHSNRPGLEGLELQARPWKPFASTSPVSSDSFWEMADCPPLRVDDELPRPVDEVRALGNAVVPSQAREAFERLMGLK